MAQTNILLPEKKGVSVGVRRQALSAVVAADCPHTLDGLHKLWRLPEPVEVEGELCVFDGLSCRDCKVRTESGQEIKSDRNLFYFTLKHFRNRDVQDDTISVH